MGDGSKRFPFVLTAPKIAAVNRKDHAECSSSNSRPQHLQVAAFGYANLLDRRRTHTARMVSIFPPVARWSNNDIKTKTLVTSNSTDDCFITHRMKTEQSFFFSMYPCSMTEEELATAQQYACPSHDTKHMILPVLDAEEIFGICSDTGSTLPSHCSWMVTYRLRTATLCSMLPREASISYPAEGRRE